jgi:hypothetical protein
MKCIKYRLRYLRFGYLPGEDVCNVNSPYNRRVNEIFR